MPYNWLFSTLFPSHDQDPAYTKEYEADGKTIKRIYRQTIHTVAKYKKQRTKKPIIWHEINFTNGLPTNEIKRGTYMQNKQRVRWDKPEYVKERKTYDSNGLIKSWDTWEAVDRNKKVKKRL